VINSSSKPPLKFCRRANRGLIIDLSDNQAVASGLPNDVQTGFLQTDALQNRHARYAGPDAMAAARSIRRNRTWSDSIARRPSPGEPYRLTYHYLCRECNDLGQHYGAL